MDSITIKDKTKQLTFAVDDLKAISSIILTVGDHEEYANAYEALKVIDKALTSITDDIQEAVDGICAALENLVREE